MERIVYPTMDALSYARLRAVNTGYDFMGYKNFGYQATDIPVPMPTECPCCKKTMSSDLTPIIAVNNLLPFDEMDNDEEDFRVGDKCKVVSIYRCTSCNSLFTIWSEHKASADEHHRVEWSCEIQNLYPFDTHTTVFSDEINGLSSEFVDIYNQAELAEAQTLDELCGMGYRGALEFLVDAYIRKIKPNEIINPSLELGKKINNYIDDFKIKTLAEKAAWLGNDATHIVDKHPDRDIVTDMKKFIKAMTTMIDAEFAYEDANTIQKGQK